MNRVRPAGRYSVARQQGSLVYTAGMTPRSNGALTVIGVVGENLAAPEATAAAAVAARRALDAARECLAEGDELEGVLSMTVYVSAAASFTDYGRVADGASELLEAEFPFAPLPVRAAIGVASLPGGAPVEVQLIATIASS